MTAAFDLLGGAERRKTRARGFAPWNPQPAAQALLALVQAVLAEYAEYLPLTIRQVFYRLVGAHGFEKTERAYERLCENLNRARRARLIPMDAIRDDGGQTVTPSAWEGAEDFLSAVRAQAERLVLDRTAGQPTRLIVMCEAAGMVPQLARVTTLRQHDDEAWVRPMATREEPTGDAMAKFAGTVTRCPPGQGRAPDAKEYGQAQFKCRCGHAGTMAYPKLFKRLRRRRKPLRLRCERCGWVR